MAETEIERLHRLMSEAPSCPTCGLPMVRHGRSGPPRYCPLDGWQEVGNDG